MAPHTDTLRNPFLMPATEMLSVFESVLPRLVPADQGFLRLNANRAVDCKFVRLLPTLRRMAFRGVGTANRTLPIAAARKQDRYLW